MDRNGPFEDSASGNRKEKKGTKIILTFTSANLQN